MRISVMLSAVALLTTTFVTGCADDTDDTSTTAAATGATLSSDEEACEHMVEGPFQDVTATAASDGAPSATYAHTAVHITLATDTTDDTMYMGYVTYEADEATEFALFLSVDAPLAIHDAAGNDVEIEASEAVLACDEVAMEHLVDFEVGTYTLVIGPTAAAEVTLIAEEANHAGHDDNDDEHDDEHDDEQGDEHGDDDHADDDNA